MHRVAQAAHLVLDLEQRMAGSRVGDVPVIGAVPDRSARGGGPYTEFPALDSALDSGAVGGAGIAAAVDRLCEPRFLVAVRRSSVPAREVDAFGPRAGLPVLPVPASLGPATEVSGESALAAGTGAASGPPRATPNTKAAAPTRAAQPDVDIGPPSQ